MTKRFRSFAFLIASVFTVMAFSAGTASAQYPPAALYGVTCSPQSISAGSNVSCTVEGAQANEALVASAAEDGEQFFTQSLTANADGEANFAFQVADDADGQITVTVEGDVSGTTGTTVTVSDDDAEGTVTEDGEAVATATGQLPFTGGEVSVLLMAGFGLLGAGLLFLRRREDSRVSASA